MKLLLSLFLIVVLLVAPVAASIQVYRTPLTATNPPGTERLVGGPCKIDYTAIQPDPKNPLKIQFKDLSKGTVTKIHYEWGDGSPCYEGTNRNPVHVFKKPGYYIGSCTIWTKEYKFKLWVHKTVIIK